MTYEELQNADARTRHLGVAEREALTSEQIGIELAFGHAERERRLLLDAMNAWARLTEPQKKLVRKALKDGEQVIDRHMDRFAASRLEQIQSSLPGC